MQAVIAIPDFRSLQEYGGSRRALMRVVCGVPLLVRVVKMAVRAGADSFVFLWPWDEPLEIWTEVREALRAEKIERITMLCRDEFQMRKASSWAGVAEALEERFLWIPWNWVTHKRALTGLELTAEPPSDWSVPVLVAKEAALRVMDQEALSAPREGVPVTSRRTAVDAERFLVAHSGKPLDGIYSKFNRWLCRPAVHMLSYTRETPNAITLGGLAVAIAAALLFARGTYFTYAAGALLFFLSGLFDEMDGMIARLKFRESAFGTWFEGFVDNVTYLLIFAGITIGLYRQYGTRELVYGAALIGGCVLSVAVISFQRKRSTDAARPHEYLGRMYGLLEQDSSNWVSWAVRHVHVFLKKGVAVHYLLIFTLLGWLPAFLRLAALGSNLTWIFGLYFSRRFFRGAHITA